jgi:hypothetical protein
MLYLLFLLSLLTIAVVQADLWLNIYSVDNMEFFNAASDYCVQHANGGHIFAIATDEGECQPRGGCCDACGIKGWCYVDDLGILDKGYSCSLTDWVTTQGDIDCSFIGTAQFQLTSDWVLTWYDDDTGGEQSCTLPSENYELLGTTQSGQNMWKRWCDVTR